MKINDVVILVGGLGTRLGSITKQTPKPLIKINNVCFLDQLISKLIKYKYKNIYLLCSYKKEIFFKKYNNKIFHKTKVICIYEGKPKGTGGALFKIRNKIKNKFILLNGDTYFDVDFNIFNKIKLEKDNIFMCITHKKKSFNNYKLNNLSIINKRIKFSKKNTNFINGGIYLINKKILKNIKNKYSSFENDILSTEIKKNKVIGKIFKDFFVDIGSYEKLNFIKKHSKIMQNKCFFLDRDGVINKECGYITNFKDFILLKGVKEAISLLNKSKFLVIIITNQAVVGKGIITEKRLLSIHSKMIDMISFKKNAYIDDIYYSPYFKNSKILKYKKNQQDRKPNPGMILKAKQKWNIDLSSSFFIGDKITDKIAAKKSNLKFYFKKDMSLYKQVKSIIK